MPDLSTAASPFRRRLLALTDPASPADLGRRGRIVVWGIVLLALLSTLAIPLAPDAGIFFTVARKLLDGGLLYRDIVDIKPPLIYHMDAGAMLLLGETATAVRAMDVLLQLVTCWLLWRIVKRAGGGELMAASAVLAYVLMLLSSGAHTLGQVETYMGLFALPLLRGTLLERRRGWVFAAGACAGALTLLKFTFGITLVGGMILLWFFGSESERERLRLALLLLAGWFCVMLLFAGYLMLPGVFDAWREVLAFTSAYTSSGWKEPGTFLKNLLSEAVWQMARQESVLFLLLAVMGAALAARVVARRGGETPTLLHLLRATLLLLALVWVTIVIEGRFFDYHFARIDSLLAIPTAAGAVWMLGLVAAAPRRWSGWTGGMVTAIAVAGALYLSPVVTALWRSEVVALKQIVRMLGVGGMEMGDKDMAYQEGDNVARALSPRIREGDELMVVAEIAGVIYERCGVVPHYRLTHSAMFTTDYTLPAWREETWRHLLERRPRFVVVQIGEGIAVPRNHVELATLRANPDCAALLDTAYTELLRTGAVVLYERRSPGA